MSWRECTGRGVRVAIIDSGIHAAHPHVGGLAGGDVDRLGHGTAVAGAIREKAADAELYAIRVFDRSLSTSVARLAAAIVRAADAGADLVNLSLGTQRQEHRTMLVEAVAYAAQRGAVVIAAEESDGVRWLPGSLPGVLPVRLDWECPRDGFRTVDSSDGPKFLASGYPRPIPGVPREANLKGISFAVANMTGFAARARQAVPASSTATIAAFLAKTATFAEELDIIVN